VLKKKPENISVAGHESLKALNGEFQLSLELMKRFKQTLLMRISQF
jgi:hypothetical protein